MKLNKCNVKQSKYRPQISPAEHEKVRLAVHEGIKCTERNIATYDDDLKVAYYGKFLRANIINLLSKVFPSSYTVPGKNCKRIVINPSFSFYVTAEQDFERTAGYKIADSGYPDMLQETFADDCPMINSKYELVLSYDAPRLIKVSLMSHNPMLEAIIIYSLGDIIDADETSAYQEQENAMSFVPKKNQLENISGGMD